MVVSGTPPTAAITPAPSAVAYKHKYGYRPCATSLHRRVGGVSGRGSPHGLHGPASPAPPTPSTSGGGTYFVAAKAACVFLVAFLPLVCGVPIPAAAGATVESHSTAVIVAVVAIMSFTVLGAICSKGGNDQVRRSSVHDADDPGAEEASGGAAAAADEAGTGGGAGPESGAPDTGASTAGTATADMATAGTAAAVTEATTDDASSDAAAATADADAATAGKTATTTNATSAAPSIDVPPGETLFTLQANEIMDIIMPELKRHIEDVRSAKPNPSDEDMAAYEDKIKHVLTGRLDMLTEEQLRGASSVIRTFLSSTFTDTKVERDTFIFLTLKVIKKLCTDVSLEHGNSEMRWGINDDMSQSHQTSTICMKELQRCKESAGLEFIGMLFDKSGYAPFPAAISKPMYEQLRAVVSGEDGATMDQHFKLDTNCREFDGISCDGGYYRYLAIKVNYPDYVLPKDTPENAKKKKAANDAYWAVFEKLQKVLRDAAVEAGLPPEDQVLFTQSVTADEMDRGIAKQADPKKSLLLLKTITGLDEAGADAAGFKDWDWAKGEFSAEAAEKQAEQKRKLTQLGHRVIDCGEVPWRKGGTDMADPEHKSYMAKLMGSMMRESIIAIANAKRAQMRPLDAVEAEAFAQARFLADKVGSFVGREAMVDKGVGCIESAMAAAASGEDGATVVFWGSSGRGKTGLIAKCSHAALQRVDAAGGKAPVFLGRFLGTSPWSSDAASLMRHLCDALKRSYGDSKLKLPGPDAKFDDVIKAFFGALALAKADRPLLLMLDSLDQLTDADQGRQLKWLLKRKLPPHVTLILSTLPEEGGCLSACDKVLGGRSSDAFIEVEPLQMGGEGGGEAGKMLDHLLQQDGRALTPDQRSHLLNTFYSADDANRTPLLLSLLYSKTEEWSSWDEVADLPELKATAVESIHVLYDDLEEKYGVQFTTHLLGLLSASRDGLSVSELEDLLSMSDAVLNEIFAWWVAPFARIAPLMLTRFLSDLEKLMVFRGGRGKGDTSRLLMLYHRQFREVAYERYVTNSAIVGQDGWGEGKQALHSMLAAYFGGTYSAKMPFAHSNQKRFPDPFPHTRLLPANPLLYKGGVGEWRPNTRRVAERLYHLLQNERAYEAADEVCDVQYAMAMAAAGLEHDMLQEMGDVVKAVQSAQDQAHAESNKTNDAQERLLLGKLKVKVEQALGFFGQLTLFLREHPKDVAGQVATTAPAGSWLQKAGLKAMADVGDTEHWEVIMGQRNAFDPCKLAINCHTGINGRTSVNCFKISPDGKRTLSGAGGGGSSSDNTLRICDAVTGAELVKIEHSDRVLSCDWHPDGTSVVSGSADRSITVWDSASGEPLCTMGELEAPVVMEFTVGKGEVLFPIKPASQGNVANIDHMELAHGKVYMRLSTAGPHPGRDELTHIQGVDLASMGKISQEDGKQLNSVTRRRVRIIKVGEIEDLVKHLEGMPRPLNLTIRRAIDGHTDEVKSVAFAPDGKTVASGSNDTSVRIWDAESGAQRTKLGALESPVVVEETYQKFNEKTRSSDRIFTMSAVDDRVIINTSQKGPILSEQGHPYKHPPHDVVTHIDGVEISTMGLVQTNNRKVKLGEIDDLTLHLNKKIQDADVTLTILRQFKVGHTGPVYAVAFSGDAKDQRLVTGGTTYEGRGELQVWKPSTGEQLYVKAESGTVLCVAFSPGTDQTTTPTPHRTMIAATVSSTCTRVLDAATGEELRELKGHKYGPTGVCFHPKPGSNLVGTVGGDFTVRMWNIESGEQLMQQDGANPCISMWWDEAAAGSTENAGTGLTIGTDMKLYDAAAACNATTEEFAHGSYVIATSFSKDSKMMLTGSFDKTIKLWDIPADGAPTMRRSFEGHKNGIARFKDYVGKLGDKVRFSADNRHIWSQDSKGNIIVFDVDTGEQMFGGFDMTTMIETSPDGTKVAAGCKDKSIRVFDAKSGKEKMMLEGHTAEVDKFSFTSDGECIWSMVYEQRSTVKGDVLIFNVMTGERVLADFEIVGPLESTSDGDLYAAACKDGKVRIWNKRTYEQIYVREHKNPASEVAFSLDGRFLWCARQGGEHLVYDVVNGNRGFGRTGYWSGLQHTMSGNLASSPDGTKYASAGHKDVWVWDANTLKAIHTFEGHTGGYGVKELHFSDDSRYVWSRSTTYDRNLNKTVDADIITFDTTTGERASDIPNPSDAAKQLKVTHKRLPSRNLIISNAVSDEVLAHRSAPRDVIESTNASDSLVVYGCSSGKVVVLRRTDLAA